MKFACDMGVLVMAFEWYDRHLLLSRDRKLQLETKCTHLQVAGLRLEGYVVGSKVAIAEDWFFTL